MATRNPRPIMGNVGVKPQENKNVQVSDGFST
jgi:hypothetical protein